MAALNEAYRVLADPGRRALYDRTLDASGRPTSGSTTTGSAAGGARSGARAAPGPGGGGVDDDEDLLETLRRPRTNYPGDELAPARVPWKLLGVMAALGIGLVLAGAVLFEPAAEPGPDGVIRQGSCVTIEPNSDAREVSCTGEDDLVVEALVPLDARCPGGTSPHRDRQGMGIACVRVPSDP